MCPKCGDMIIAGHYCTKNKVRELKFAGTKIEEAMVRMKIHPDDIGLKHPRYIKSGKTKRPKSSDSHDELQDLAEQYLNANRIPFIHIPDILLRFIQLPDLAMMLRNNKSLYGWLMGVKKQTSEYLTGVPDLIIFRQTGDVNLSLGIEFKTGQSKLRKGQRKWFGKIKCYEMRDFESFKKIVDEF